MLLKFHTIKDTSLTLTLHLSSY